MIDLNKITDKLFKILITDVTEEDIKEVKEDFHREEIEQAVFRAEVRESLNNWEDRFDTIAPPR